MSYYRIGDIKANPFRNIERYPICRKKVERLRESLRKTGPWDNMIGRLVNGEPEITYGHHRMVALEEEYGKDRKIKLNISDMDDDKMILLWPMRTWRNGRRMPW